MSTLRVATVWGTTVLDSRLLVAGASYGSGVPGGVALPDDLDAPELTVRARPEGGWDLDPRGAVAGVLQLRGSQEDPVKLARAGAMVPITPGDFGLVQYGQIAIFFQTMTEAQPLPRGTRFELLSALAVFSSLVVHGGGMAMLRSLVYPPPIPLPGELETPDEFAAKFGLRRTMAEIMEPPPPPASGADASGGSKSPSPKKAPEAAKMAGAEGKLGKVGNTGDTRLSGEPVPVPHLGGLSDVLASDTGEEIKKTLESIDAVSGALSGLNAQTLLLGGGSGSGLRGSGSGGGGIGLGVPFGAGNLQTGTGGGNGTGGHGSGRGSGTGAGSGSGNGAGSGGPGEAKVAVSAGTPTAHGGLSAEQIQRVVNAHLGALRACYEAEAQKNPGLQGGVAAGWQIEPAGTVASDQVVSSSLSNARVEGCILRQIKTWHFPASDSQTIVSSYGFKFGLGS